jgi:hypothetical protein
VAAEEPAEDAVATRSVREHGRDLVHVRATRPHAEGDQRVELRHHLRHTRTNQCVGLSEAPLREPQGYRKDTRAKNESVRSPKNSTVLRKTRAMGFKSRALGKIFVVPVGALPVPVSGTPVWA